MSGEGNHRAYISSLLGNEAFECVIESIVDKKKFQIFIMLKVVYIVIPRLILYLIVIFLVVRV